MKPVIHLSQIKLQFRSTTRPTATEVKDSFYNENSIQDVMREQINVKLLRESGRGEYTVRLVFPGKVRGQLNNTVRLFGSSHAYVDKLGLNYCSGCYSLAHTTMECRATESQCFSCQMPDVTQSGLMNGFVCKYINKN